MTDIGNRFKLGDKVIEDKQGYTYSSHDTWAQKHLSDEQYELWVKSRRCYCLGNKTNSTKGKVIALGDHGYNDDILCAVLTRRPGIYIISQNGLRRN